MIADAAWVLMAAYWVLVALERVHGFICDAGEHRRDMRSIRRRITEVRTETLRIARDAEVARAVAYSERRRLATRSPVVRA